MLINNGYCRLLFIGDHNECAKILPYAKRQAEKYWQIYQYSTYHRETIKGPFDSRIRITLDRVSNFTTIEIVTAGCKLVHGFFDLILPEKPIISEVDPTWDLIRESGQKYKALYRLYPRQEKESDNSIIYGDWQYSEELVTNYTLDTSSGHRNSLVYKVPGNYSGLMRQIVQLLIGQGKPVPYEYNFYETHGILKSSTGKYWVIEISRDAGVLAWELPVCREISKTSSSIIESEILAELPIIPKFEELSSQKKKTVQLLHPSALKVYYENSPFFHNCGWAFDYNGNFAQNTCWTMDDNIGGYIRSFRYQIAIIEDAGGTPKGASLTVLEDGVVHGNRVNGFKVPHDLLGIIDFDLYYNNTTQYPNSTGPLYVYYDRNNQPIIARMSPIIAASASTYTRGNPVGLNPTPITSEDSGWIDIEGTTSRPANPIVDGGHSPDNIWTGNYWVVNLYPSDRNGYFTSTDGGSDPRQLINNEFRESYGDAHLFANSSRTSGISLIVPFYDREAIYSCKYTLDNEGTSVTDYAIATGTYTRGTIVACLAGGGGGCDPGKSGWGYNETFASDPRVGTYSSTWVAAGFARELPYLPTSSGQVVCVPSTAYLGQNSFWTSTVDFTPVRGTISIKLITSNSNIDVHSQSFDDISILSSPYYRPFNFADGSNFMFAAIYSDAFNSKKLFAYKTLNLHEELYSTANPYPDIVGTVVPKLFVGKP